jgi:hypothetical protein
MSTDTFLLKKGLAALGLTLAAASSHAALILDTPSSVNLQGTGVGNVNTVLTIASPNSTSSESGSVSFNGATVTSGDVQSGGSGQVLNQAVTLQSAGFTSAATLASDLANLRIVFNANEPNGDGITLNNLALSIFSPTGTNLFTSGVFTAQNFASTAAGTGNSGFVFKLDGADLAAATTALSGANFNLNDRIGLAASATNATGGFESFFTVKFLGGATGGGGGGGGGTGGQVPEPATLAILGLGMAALGAVRRRSRKD